MCIRGELTIGDAMGTSFEMGPGDIFLPRARAARPSRYVPPADGVLRGPPERLIRFRPGQWANASAANYNTPSVGTWVPKPHQLVGTQ
jgi:hypothetical protein